MPKYKVVISPEEQEMELMALDRDQAERMATDLFQFSSVDIKITEISD